jgi:NADH dehydrogenase FAD-containing subunit
MARRVVIIGGGYAGTAAARALDKVADVTLVDRKDAFFHRIASLRAAVDPAWAAKPFFTYDRLLTRGRFVHAEVTGLDVPRAVVTLDSGQGLPFDAAIIATGAEARDPARFVGRTTPEAVAAMRARQQEIADARSVVIVGGGPVGVELAGEIRAVHAHKPVTLVQDVDRLLPGDHTPALGRRAKALLEAQHITVQLGERLSGGDAERDPGELVLWAVGTRPNSAWLATDHPRLLTAQATVRVDRFLRVDGCHNVFAIGDISDVAVGKLVLPAVAQAKTAAANVKAVLAGSSPAKVYRARNPKLLVVPVGPRHGVTMLPLSPTGTLVGSRATSKMKGEELLVPRYRKAVGHPARGEAGS